MEISTSSIHEAYVAICRTVMQMGLRSSPRGKETAECLNLDYCVSHPKFEAIRTRDPARNAVIKEYCERELKLYRAGELDANVWRNEGSKFWWELRNPDDTINSNYGYLTQVLRDVPVKWTNAKQYWQLELEDDYITQWEWAYHKLNEDSDTRQAVMHFNRHMHQWFGNKDFPCTMYGIFHIRQGQLIYTTHMRSQDIVKGLVYDLPYFAWQQEYMAKALDRPVGKLYGFVNSMHAYRSDYDTIYSMIGEKR